jgi:hypothetical protein
MILQVSHLPDTSDPEEFFYGLFADIEGGDFAAARAFFIHNSHTIIYHKSPNTVAFQELFPLALICYLSLLPCGLIAKGFALLEAQHVAQCKELLLQDPLPITPS